MTVIPINSIIMACPHLCGRLGNYLFNIAFSSNILYNLESFRKCDKYLYFNCDGLANDGHENTNIFHYKGNNIYSYCNSILKFNKLYENDFTIITHEWEQIKLVSITNYENNIKNLTKRIRFIKAIDADIYEIYFDAFPVIIEIYVNNNILTICLNNMLYEGIEIMADFTKNLYLSNDVIYPKIVDMIKNIMNKYNNVLYTFIKLDFSIISSHLTFHSDEFNLYFSKKIFNFNINNIPSKIYIKDIYNNIKNKYGDKTLFISMHFRGSDYGDPAKQTECFAVIGPDYYINCIDNIYLNNHPNYTDYVFVFFCSNDDTDYITQKYIPYVNNKINKKNIAIIHSNQFISDNTILYNDHFNLYFMGLFDYMCLSNSTYSWWSSYFSDNYLKNNHIYIPLIYQYPLSHEEYNTSYFTFNYNNEDVTINNYVVNVFVWYGYTSSIYIYLLFKRFLKSFSDNINNIKLDSYYLTAFANNILRVMKENHLIQNDDMFKTISCDKNNIVELLSYIEKNVFVKKHFTLIYKDTNIMRYKLIKINNIMMTKDRTKDKNIFYKNLNIDEGIININI